MHQFNGNYAKKGHEEYRVTYRILRDEPSH